MKQFALLVFTALVHAARVQAAEVANVEYTFYVSAKESYSDYVQFSDGHAQGVCVFYFVEPVGDKKLNRLVVFCSGDDKQGKVYEDSANNRIVWTRPLSEYTSFTRYQQDLKENTVYGGWTTRADGEVTQIGLQYYRQGGKNFGPKEPGPKVGVEYTGKSR
jgi:hypothetical protein